LPEVSFDYLAETKRAGETTAATHHHPTGETMMKAVNIYLNFAGTTEEAFNFYKSIFGGEFMGGIMRFRDFPPMEGMEDMPPLKEEEKDLVGHVSLPLTEQATLMGTDFTSNMPEKLIVGNNFQITLEADSAAETETLFGKLSDGGRVVMPLSETFWAEKFGGCVDKFVIHWQINYTGNKDMSS
jgi:PhnB protein